MSSEAPDTIWAWEAQKLGKRWSADFQGGNKYVLASTVEREIAELRENLEIAERALDAQADFLAKIAERDAEIERMRANLAAIEDEKNAYIDYVGDALGQDYDRETLWDAAQRVLSERDRYRVIVDRLLEAADSDPFGTVGHFVEHGPASVEIGGLREVIAAVEQGGRSDE